MARDVEERRRARQPEIVVPHFDPAETGVRSQVLLLLEAPGPKTVPEWGGSGFISVDNDDPTAQNLWRTRDEVGFYRGVLVWNIVPWVLGRASVKPTPWTSLREPSNCAGSSRSCLTLRAIVPVRPEGSAGWDAYLDLAIGDRYRCCARCTTGPVVRAGRREGALRRDAQEGRDVRRPGRQLTRCSECSEGAPASPPRPFRIGQVVNPDPGSGLAQTGPGSDASRSPALCEYPRSVLVTEHPEGRAS